jgi:hypothetical protein
VVFDFGGEDAFDFFGGHAAFDHGAFEVVVGSAFLDFRPIVGGDGDNGDGEDAGDGERVLVPNNFGKHADGSFGGPEFAASNGMTVAEGKYFHADGRGIC